LPNQVISTTLAYDSASLSLADWLVAESTTVTANSVTNLISAKADKDAEATDDNQAAFSTGNPVDSGMGKAELSTAITQSGMRLAAAVSSGTTFTTETAPDSEPVGSYVALVTGDEDTEIRRVTAVDGTTVTVS